MPKLTALLILIFLTTSAQAKPVITHARLQQTVAGQRTAIATFSITNPSGKPDRLLMVWFRASHRAHIVRVRGLQIINKGLYLPPHGRIALTAGTTAVLLTQLRQSLQPEWQPYEAILTFEQAGDVEVQFTVVRNRPKGQMMR